MTAKKYDSKAERAFHARHPELISLQNEYYRSSFTDENGDVFRAKPDFFDPNFGEAGAYIEFKCHQLNTKQTRSASHAAENKIFDYKGGLSQVDQLKNSWNHSLYKQAIVQSTLDSKDIQMIVVFEKNTKLSTQNKNKMAEVGLKYVMESDYFF
ncbi:TPA: hypothetical protein ACX6Q5_000320 [Photobacterium damselae]